MAGNSATAFVTRHHITAYGAAAVTVGQILGREVMTFKGKIAAVRVNGITAGSGTGYTTIDVQINGSSIWDHYDNRPTLLAVSTGEFTNAPPSPKCRDINPGDIVTITVPSISTTGHARLCVTATVELGV